MMRWLQLLFVTVVTHNILVRAVQVSGCVRFAADSLRSLVRVFQELRL